jgi:hypothetical protein
MESLFGDKNVLIMLFHNIVKKQSCISKSTMKAEYTTFIALQHQRVSR